MRAWFAHKMYVDRLIYVKSKKWIGQFCACVARVTSFRWAIRSICTQIVSRTYTVRVKNFVQRNKSSIFVYIRNIVASICVYTQHIDGVCMHVHVWHRVTHKNHHFAGILHFCVYRIRVGGIRVTTYQYNGKLFMVDIYCLSPCSHVRSLHVWMIHHGHNRAPDHIHVYISTYMYNT